MDVNIARDADCSTLKHKKAKKNKSLKSNASKGLHIEDIVELGGDESDVELVNAVEDDDEFEAVADELEADAIDRSEVEDFITKLGIRDLLKKKSPAKIKLKSVELADDADEDSDEDEKPHRKTGEKLGKSGDKPDRKTKVSKSSEETNKTDSTAKKKGLLQNQEACDVNIIKSADWISQYQPRKYLLVKPGVKWFDCRFESDPSTYQPAPADVVARLERFAARLLDDETALHRKQQEASKKSSVAWLKTVLTSGTLTDKTAALVLLIQEAPVHSLPGLDTLIALTKKKGRREALQVSETLKELFMSDLLLENAKLKTFEQHPLAELERLSSGNKDSHDKRLILWYFESQLKKKYAEFIASLETLSHDAVGAIRKKATAVVFQLLAEKPEQEKVLLSMLVNKLGDPDYKGAAHAAHLLTKLVDQHSNMKMVVVVELERLLYRPHISAKAQYYGICFLNQLFLSHEERQLASRLVTIYFNFFKVFVKKGEVESKMLSALLTGVNRAYPYAKADRQNILSQIDMLYKIVHISPFNTGLHALMLLFQVVDVSDSTSDRYYVALYRKLLDPALQSSNKLSLFLNLLFKSLKRDLMDRRVQAFVKRILQVCQSFTPSFICGALVLLSELLKMRPSLLKLTKISQELDDDEEEHFVDVDDGDDEKTTSQTIDSEAVTTATQKEPSSWVHRNNLTCKPGSYDPLHRNPLYCHADSECTWELLCLAAHYHPSVSLFAKSLLKGEYLTYSSNPLEDFTLMRFLDRFVYRNPKKEKDAASIQSAGVRHPTKSSLLTDIRKIPVNSDAYLQKDEEQIPADERFFYRFFRQQAAAGKRREPNDVDSDADDVSDDEFDAFLDKFEHGLEDPDFDVDFAADMSKHTTQASKKKKQAESDEESSSGDEDGEAEDEAEDNLSDEEIDFGDDFDMDMGDDDEIGGPQGADFDEEEVEFSDEDGSPPANSKKRKLSRHRGSDDGELFAAAEDFSHLIESDAGSMLGMVGTNAVSRADNAGAKQLKWEADRERWVNDRHRPSKKHKQGSRQKSRRQHIVPKIRIVQKKRRK